MAKRINALGLFLVLALAAVALAWALPLSGLCPQGSDSLAWLHKAQVLLSQVQQGGGIPRVDLAWYNGADWFRGGGVLPAAVLALCLAARDSDAMGAYCLYVPALFFVSSCIWLYLGYRRERPLLGALLGVLWFFAPSSLYVLFSQGDLALAMALALLPAFFGAVEAYVRRGRRRALLAAEISFFLLMLCAWTCGAVAAAGVFLCLALHRAGRAHLRGVVEVLALGTLCAALPLYLARCESSGGVAQSLKSLFEVFPRQMQGGVYLGAAALAVCLFGLLLGRAESRPAFGAGALVALFAVVLCSGFSFLPDGRPVVPLLAAVFCFLTLMGLLQWNTLRPVLVVLVCLLLTVDAMPSCKLMYGDWNGISLDDHLDEMGEYSLLKEAKANTKQRLTLLDGGVLGAEGAWLVSDTENAAAAVAGGDLRQSVIRQRLVQLNEAANAGDYLYLFDRCMELGSDTVVIRQGELPSVSRDELALVRTAAEQVGYRRVSKNDRYLVYHLDDAPDTFGTVAKYRAIAIGTASGTIARCFPAVEETTSLNLNDYTYQQLSAYDLVILSGFTYRDRESAEQMLLQLSENGTHIVIQADGIPSDERTGTQSFLGVQPQRIQFSNGYPELHTRSGRLNCDLFPDGYSKWQTVYVNGLDECWGYLDDLDQRLEFLGTVKNDHIVVVGLNLTYFYALTKDAGVGALLAETMQLSPEELPERRAVPVEIEAGAEGVSVRCEEDGVNTALAWHDFFQSEQAVEVKNGLLCVKGGTTVVTYRKTELLAAGGISLGGAAWSLLWLCRRKKNRKGESRA